MMNNTQVQMNNQSNRRSVKCPCKLFLLMKSGKCSTKLYHHMKTEIPVNIIVRCKGIKMKSSKQPRVRNKFNKWLGVGIRSHISIAYAVQCTRSKRVSVLECSFYQPITHNFLKWIQLKRPTSVALLQNCSSTTLKSQMRDS